MKLIAYLDPGTGTIIMQAVLGGAAGVAVLFKSKGRFGKKRKDDGTSEVDATTDTPEGAEPAAIDASDRTAG